MVVKTTCYRDPFYQLLSEARAERLEPSCNRVRMTVDAVADRLDTWMVTMAAQGVCAMLDCQIPAPIRREFR